MPRSNTKYHLLALDRVNMCVIDEVFDTLESMVEKHGEALDITRRRCKSIRRKTTLAMKKYKHICIEDVMPEGMKMYTT